MRIETGLFDNMVLQRDSKNMSNAKVKGSFTLLKKAEKVQIKAFVTQNGKAIKGVTFDTQITGSPKAGGSAFDGRLKGVSTGGPYNIKLVVEAEDGREVASISVKNILVGDVWILAGQSNMQGIGNMKDALTPHEMTRAFFMDYKWGVAKDPLHELHLAVEDVHVKELGAVEGSKLFGVGPGVSFAQEMFRKTGVPQGMIACAHGGTTMTQWSPDLKSKGRLSLYGSMLRRFETNGGSVAGVIWYQGCSDANDEATVLYTERMKTFVKSVRQDFKSKDLPFVVVQISRVCGNVLPGPKNWNSVQDQQRLLQKIIKKVAVVPAIDLALDDGIHINGADQARLGKRLAQATLALTSGDKREKMPIMLKDVKVVRNKLSNTSDVMVTFDNVIGSLRSTGRPSGFELSNNREILDAYQIFRIDLSGNKVIIRTSIQDIYALTRYLFYGYGIQPFCNITDEADRSLPMFGPIIIPAKVALTPFVTKTLVSEFQKSAGKLESLEFPKNQKQLGFKEVSFPENFCSLHKEIAAQNGEDNVVYYKFFVGNSVEMSLDFNLGYDGPVKVWVDGALKFYDPKGINPASSDDANIHLTISPGKHEFLIALGTNFSKAWGVFLRFERLDLTEEILSKGPDFYELPKITVE